MAHQRKLIRQAVIALLVGANTSAAGRVKDTHVDPIRPVETPMISVYTLSESTIDSSDDTAPREISRDLNLEITAWVSAAPDAMGAAMDDIAEQIEAILDDNWLIPAAFVVSAVDHTTGQLTVPAHARQTGDPVSVGIAVGGALPPELAAGRGYYAIVIDANTMKIATSVANALNGTAVTFSTNGTLPLQLTAPMAANSIIAGTEQQVIQGGSSDPLIGVVTLTYTVTYRSYPTAANVATDDFIRADTNYPLVGGVADTEVVEDTFTVQES